LTEPGVGVTVALRAIHRLIPPAPIGDTVRR
jgi:hypothetical protein